MQPQCPEIVIQYHCQKHLETNVFISLTHCMHIPQSIKMLCTNDALTESYALLKSYIYMAAMHSQTPTLSSFSSTWLMQSI